MSEIDTPWMPSEIVWLYNFRKGSYATKKWNGEWLEAERILTYSEKLRPLSCKCHITRRKDGVINMMNKLGSKLDELYDKYGQST